MATRATACVDFPTGTKRFAGAASNETTPPSGELGCAGRPHATNIREKARSRMERAIGPWYARAAKRIYQPSY
jgi:hypothetical protein